MHQGEIDAIRAAFLDEAFVVELHQVVVLGMDRHQAAVARDFFHRELHAAIVEPKRQALGMRRQNLGGEDLESRKAIVDGVADLIENFKRQGAAESEMK